MTPLRDTYHDFIEEQELMNAGPRASDMFVKSRIAALLERSGARNVASSAIHVDHDLSRMVLRYCVTFSSSAWTGMTKESA